MRPCHRLLPCPALNSLDFAMKRTSAAAIKKLQQMKLPRDELLKKLGAALHGYPVGARLVQTQ